LFTYQTYAYVAPTINMTFQQSSARQNDEQYHPGKNRLSTVTVYGGMKQPQQFPIILLHIKTVSIYYPAEQCEQMTHPCTIIDTFPKMP